jgi:hypothetical protein
MGHLAWAQRNETSEIQVTLLMESKGWAPRVRSLSFSDNWSRLYKAGDYIIDMSCASKGQSSNLKGQILLEGSHEARSDAAISLYNKKSGEVGEAQLDEWGQFQLGIAEQGIYDLTLKLSDATITIPLDIR